MLYVFHHNSLKHVFLNIFLFDTIFCLVYFINTYKFRKYLILYSVFFSND